MESPRFGGDSKGRIHRRKVNETSSEDGFHPMGSNSDAHSKPEKFSRQNVKFVKKEDKLHRKAAKKSMTLDDYIRYGKKVEREVAQPLIDKVNENIIPNQFQDEIDNSIVAKVSAFPRTLDGAFTEKFAEEYSEFRQQAWRKACAYSKKNPGIPSFSQLKGINFLPNEDMMLWSPIPSSVYVSGSISVDLPRAHFASIKLNVFESSRILSGLDDGRVSNLTEFTQYNTHIDLDDHVIYIDELDELKYIYRSFWYLTRVNRKDWLQAIYSRRNEKVVDFNLPSWMAPHGMRMPDDRVPLSIEGYDIYPSVDDVYYWICSFREPRKRYPIGGCENDLCVLFALLLEDWGYPRDIIHERLTTSAMEEISNWLELSVLGIPPKENPKEDEDEEAWALFGGKPEGFDISKADLPIGDVITEEKIVQVDKFNLGNFDLTALALAADEEESGDEDDDLISRREDFLEEDLPYEAILHESNNEFESWNFAESSKRVNSETESVVSETNTEDMADNQLNPVEKLGIDLIDPSRDNTYQPSLQRIGLVWDPGGGYRPIPKRYELPRGKGRGVLSERAVNRKDS